MSIKASKSLLGLGLAASLSLSSGIAAAAGNIAVLVNDTLVKAGEEIGIKLVLNGDGIYNIHLSLQGGVLGEVKYGFDENGQFAPWNDQTPPILRNGIDLGLLTVQQKIINILPKIPATGLAGTYNLNAALAIPGTVNFESTDSIEVIIQ